MRSPWITQHHNQSFKTGKSIVDTKPKYIRNIHTETSTNICKGKGRALVIAPLSRHCHRRGAQVHGAHQAVLHIPALYLPSLSWYSFTDPERMEGWVSPGPGCKEQLAHGCYVAARGQQDSNQWPRRRWLSVLTTGLSHHVHAALSKTSL